MPRPKPLLFRSTAPRIECLESRIAPAALLSFGTLAISGDDGGAAFDDHVSIGLRPGAPETIQVVQNGGAAQFFPASSVTHILFQGGAGNDALALDFLGGNLLGATANGRAISIDGGSGVNALTLLNGTATADVFSAGPAAGQAAIDLTVSGATSRITLDQVSVVNDYLGGGLTINASDSADAIAYSAGVADDWITPAPGRAKVTFGSATVQFSNKSSLALKTLGGDDVVTLANAFVPAGLTSISVDGGASGRDKLVVNGAAAAEAFEYETVAFGQGSVRQVNLATGVTQPLVSFTAIGAVEIDGGNSANADTLTLRTPAGESLVSLSAGSSADSGTLRQLSGNVDAASPLTFRQLGGAGSLVLLDGAAGARTDAFEHLGTAGVDNFSVGAAGAVSLNGRIGVHTIGVAALTLRGGDGADAFTIAAGSALATIAIDGGDLADAVSVSGTTGADAFVMTLGSASSSVAVGSTTLTLSASESVTLDGGASNDSFTVNGYATPTAVTSLAINGGGDAGDALAINTTAADDALVYRSSALGAGSFGAGAGPSLAFTGIGGALILETKGSANAADTITVEGTAGADEISLQLGKSFHTLAVIGGKTLTFSNDLHRLNISTAAGADAVQVRGHTEARLRIAIDTGAQDDVVKFLFDAGLPLPSAGVNVETGEGQDSLRLEGGTALDDVYTPGAVPGSGTSSLTVGINTRSVDFSSVESFFDTVAGSLTVRGSNGPDLMAYGDGALTGSGLVGISGRTAVEFSNKSTLRLESGGGADTITVGGRFMPAGLTSIIINGGISADTVEIQDVFATTGGSPISYRPISRFSAEVTGALPVLVSVYDTEAVQLRTAVATRTVEIVGTAAVDAITVRPGSAQLGARVEVASGNSALLPLELVGTGTLAVNGAGGSDRLNVVGGAGDDRFTSSGHLLEYSTGALSYAITAEEVETFGIEGGGGNDRLKFEDRGSLFTSYTLAPEAVNPLHQVITTLTFGVLRQFSAAGVGSIDFAAKNGDSLTVTGGAGDDEILVRRGLIADEVITAALPVISYSGLGKFTLDAGGGNDTATFRLHELAGAVAHSYAFRGDSGDSVVIEGTAYADTLEVFTSFDGKVAVREADLGKPLKVLTMLSDLGRLKINAAGGDDLIHVNSAGTAAVAIPMAIDGGLGVNRLEMGRVSGATLATLTAFGGGAGTFQYEVAGKPVPFDFTAIASFEENTTHFLRVKTPAATSRIAVSPLSATTSIVTLDGTAAVEFSAKNHVLVEAPAGSEVVVDGALTTDALFEVRVQGNGSLLTVNGTDSVERFAIHGWSATEGYVFAASMPAVIYEGVTRATVHGGGGADSFTLTGSGAHVAVFGDEGTDSVSFANFEQAVQIDIDAIGTAQTIGTLQVTLGDIIEDFVFTSFNDVIHVQGQLAGRTLDGGLHGSAQAGDTLVIDARGAVIGVRHTSADAGFASIVGYSSISYQGFETVQTEDAAAGGGTGTVLGPASFSAAVHYSAGKSAWHALRIADVNGDGAADLVLSSRAQAYFGIRLGDGDGTFGELIRANTGLDRATRVELADFDGDGDLDAALTNAQARRVSILENIDGSRFKLSQRIRVLGTPTGVTSGDLNGDGDVDLVFTTKGGHSLGVMLGADALSFGGAAFVEVGGPAPAGVRIADVDGDGRADLVAPNHRDGKVAVLRGDGTGAFAEPVHFSFGRRYTSLTIGDFNSDGRADLVASGSNTPDVRTLINTSATGEVSFDAPINTLFRRGIAPVSLATGDFNFDGIADLVFGAGRRGAVNILLGNDNGTFQSPVTFQTVASPNLGPISVAVGDLDGDGADDVAALTFHQLAMANVLLRQV